MSHIVYDSSNFSTSDDESDSFSSSDDEGSSADNHSDESDENAFAEACDEFVALCGRGDMLGCRSVLGACQDERERVVMLHHCSSDQAKYTGIHAAARYGRKVLLRFLIEDCGVDVNLLNEMGYTALHIATTSNHRDTVRYLVEQGADLNAETRTRQTALHLVTAQKDFEAATMFVEGWGISVSHLNNVECSPLMQAAFEGQSALVRYFALECGGDVNGKTVNGTGCVHHATRVGALDVVKTLCVDCGASVNEFNQDGLTALHIAVKGDHLDRVRFLIERCGADVIRASHSGHLPKHFARSPAVEDYISRSMSKT